MDFRNDIMASVVRERLNYNPETGMLTWIARADMLPQWNARFAGTAAGTISQGYLRIKIGGGIYLAHRLAWLWMTGEWPKEQIDHINGDKVNNRFANLRPATQSENKRNIGAQSNNTSGVKGIYWHKLANKWVAQINANGVHRYIGSFDEDKLDEAAAAYAKAAKKLHGEFARTK